jgi:hypothetical protein
MKTKIQLFFHVVLLGTLCVPNFAQNGELDTQSADQITRYLESLRSNEASARSRALTERTSKRARFARIGSAFLQVAREGLAKQPISAWQGISSTGGDAIPVAPPAMAQAPMAGPFALSNIAQPVQAPAAPHRLVLSPSAQQSAKRVLSALPPSVQQLWWKSIQALEPGRAETYFSYQNTKPFGYLQAECRMVPSLLQTLPAQYQQTFMNGIVGVTPEEERFAALAMNLQIKQNANASAVFAQGQEDLHRSGENYECILAGC